MAASFEDYSWIGKWRNGLLVNGYCLCLIDGLDVDGVLDHLEATDRTEDVSLTELSEACLSTWNRFSGERLHVGVAAVGKLTMMFEDNGCIGVTRELMGPIAERGSFVAHYRNVNALSWFLWLRGSTTLLEFETLFPTKRSGSMADDLVDELSGAGFDLGPTGTNVEHSTAAAFALAERISGTPVSAALLDGARFSCGVVSLPTPQT